MAKFGPKVWAGQGLEVYVTLKQAPKRTLPRWLRERLAGCTRLALVRTTGTTEEEIHSFPLAGRTHDMRDLAQRITSQVQRHASRGKAEEAFAVRAYREDVDEDEVEVNVFHWYPEVWLRIQGASGTKIRLYESLAYARCADICLVQDPTLRPRTPRRTGPRSR